MRDLLEVGEQLLCPLGCKFAVSNHIPRFVPDQAYAAGFGAQWLQFRQTQLDSHTGLPISEQRLARCFGNDLWSALSGQHVLEAGCGAGRFTELLLKRGAKVTSIDLSSAVEANKENCPISSNHRIAQADILQLPFRPRGFDIVMCLGVIQHTPSPESTIAALAEHVAPNGWLVIDHYAPSLGYYLRMTPLVRALVKRLDSRHTLPITERLVDLFLPLHRATRDSRIGRLLLSRISPVMEYYSAIPELSDAQHREWALLDTHDSLTDWYKHFRSVDQVHKALSQIGMRDVWCVTGGNGVEARARSSWSA
jgi:SAM-dependent methyltransferase